MKLTFSRQPGIFQLKADELAKNQKFAAVVALTRTAIAVKDKEVAIMRQVFDRPTPYALNGLRVKPATKQDPNALVDFKDFGSVPAGRYLIPEVEGGNRRQKSFERKIGSYVVPGKALPLDQYGNVKPATFVKILSQLKLSSDPTANASKSKRSASKRKKETYFLSQDKRMVMQRVGRNVAPVLILVDQPSYRKRYPFYETALNVSVKQFEIEFDKAFAQAMRTAR